MRAQNYALASGLTDRVELTDYSELVRTENGLEVWSDALQRALDEHQVVAIPARGEPYFLDRQIVIGSDRRIEADGATLRQTPG